MALASIEVLAGYAADDKHRLLQGVRSALVTALQVPTDDPTVRLVEHTPDSVIIPKRHSGRYTIVVVTMFAGRTLTTKRHLPARTPRLGRTDRSSARKMGCDEATQVRQLAGHGSRLTLVMPGDLVRRVDGDRPTTRCELDIGVRALVLVQQLANVDSELFRYPHESRFIEQGLETLDVLERYVTARCGELVDRAQ